MESCYTVPRLEFNDVRAHSMNDACDVIPLINSLATKFWSLPILRIRPRHDDFGDDLIRFWGWNGGVDDLDLWAFVDDRFLHSV